MIAWTGTLTLLDTPTREPQPRMICSQPASPFLPWPPLPLPWPPLPLPLARYDPHGHRVFIGTIHDIWTRTTHLKARGTINDSIAAPGTTLPLAVTLADAVTIPCPDSITRVTAWRITGVEITSTHPVFPEAVLTVTTPNTPPHRQPVRGQQVPLFTLL